MKKKVFKYINTLTLVQCKNFFFLGGKFYIMQKLQNDSEHLHVIQNISKKKKKKKKTQFLKVIYLDFVTLLYETHYLCFRIIIKKSSLN